MRPAVFMQSPTTAFRLRPAHAADLPALNDVIERAISTSPLPARVKRLTLPSYRYQPHDLAHLHLVVVEDTGGTAVGIAAWEPAHPRDLPAGRRGLLLHGLCVDPVHQGRGVGSRLLDAATDAARAQGLDGVLVKAQAAAVAFFKARCWQALAVDDPARDYPHRFWLDAHA